MPLNKHSYLYKAIDKAINSFGERHNITARQHFAPLLGLTGENGSVQLGAYLNYTTYNPAAPKRLHIDHLAILLDELQEDRKIILDAIAKEFDMVVIPQKHADTKIHDISTLVDMANIENADVFRTVKEAIADGKITEEERAAILKEIKEAEEKAAELKDAVMLLETNPTKE